MTLRSFVLSVASLTGTHLPFAIRPAKQKFGLVAKPGKPFRKQKLPCTWTNLHTLLCYVDAPVISVQHPTTLDYLFVIQKFQGLPKHYDLHNKWCFLDAVCVYARGLLSRRRSAVGA